MKKLILLILILPLAYCTVVINLARSKAENICSAIPENAPVSTAEAVVSNAGIPELKRNDPSLHEKLREPNWAKDDDLMVIVIPSVLGERWVCTVRFAQDRVSEKEVRLID